MQPVHYALGYAAGPTGGVRLAAGGDQHDISLEDLGLAARRRLDSECDGPVGVLHRGRHLLPGPSKLSSPRHPLRLEPSESSLIASHVE